MEGSLYRKPRYNEFEGKKQNVRYIEVIVNDSFVTEVTSVENTIVPMSQPRFHGLSSWGGGGGAERRETLGTRLPMSMTYNKPLTEKLMSL